MSQMTSPTATIPAWTLGWRLQRALGHAGLTTADMAEDLGVARSTISRWTNDHGAAPRAAYIKQWALRCGVPYEWLATGTIDVTDQPGAASRCTARVLAFPMAA